MAEKTSVVTPERFASGLTYADYINQIKVNKDQFDKYYATAKVSAEDARALRKIAKLINGPAKMLVLGEDWCPDVFRGMPVLARICEVVGMEMRVFPRDQHLDIMKEFLNRGEFMSVPTAVFYTKDHKYICHWIERPAAADRERVEIEKRVRAEMPGASDQDIRAEVRKRTQERYPAWQEETVKEIRQLLAKTLGV